MKQFTNALMLGAISIATLVGLNSCNKVNMTINPASAELHSGDTVVLSAVGAPADVTYETGNKYVAMTSNDTLFATFIGETVVTATSGNQQATCAVKVVPQYTFAQEPVTEFGISTAKLKELRGTDCTEQDGIISYTQDEKRGILDMYQFEDGKLVRSMLVLLASEQNAEIAYFLAERHPYAGTTEQGLLLFVDAFEMENVTMAIALGVINTGSLQAYRVDYMPYTQPANMPALNIQKTKPQYLPALH